MALSLSLMAVVALQLDLAAAARQLSRCNVGWLALAVAALLLAFAVGAERWHRLLRAADVTCTLAATFRIYVIGAFATNFLPTGFGGDAVRMWLAGKPGRRGMAAGTVIVDRMTLLLSAIVVAWLAFASDYGVVPGALRTVLLVVTLVGAGVLAIALFGARMLSRLTGRPPQFALDVRAATIACFRGWPLIGTTFVLGLLYEALTFVSVWFVANSLAIDAPFAVIAAVVPAVLILTALPISIAGYGVREGSYVVLLHQAGISTTNAALLSLLATAVYAVSTLPGAVAMIHRPVTAAAVRGRHVLGTRAATGTNATLT